MMCFAPTMLMQCANPMPVRLVLSKAAAPPEREMPSQVEIYSGQLFIRTAMQSPFLMPMSNAQRVNWFDKSMN